MTAKLPGFYDTPVVDIVWIFQISVSEIAWCFQLTTLLPS
jgi:hypothetical protein